jgi:NADPH:quinone reductase-like Zn-dependent oxidoreductase
LNAHFTQQQPHHFKVGDVVVGLVNPLKPGNSTGTWAEFALLPLATMEVKPSHLNPEQAVATYMSGMVAVVAVQRIKSTLDRAVARCKSACAPKSAYETMRVGHCFSSSSEHG